MVFLTLLNITILLCKIKKYSKRTVKPKKKEKKKMSKLDLQDELEYTKNQIIFLEMLLTFF